MAEASPGSGDSARGGLTEEQAWLVVLAVAPGSVPQAGPLTVSLSGRAAGGHGGPEDVIRVHADGSWDASCPVSADGARVLDVFLPARVPTRMVVGQLGQSLDGRIATESGHSHYINGPEDIQRLHRLRALVDAVVVGPGTVASDDPQLTVRHVPGKDPARVVLDPRGTLPADRKVFQDGGPPTLWVRPTGSDDPGVSGVRIVELDVVDQGKDGGPTFHPASVVRLLAERGLHRILVEGGGRTVSAFLDAGVLDRLHISVAPLIIGSGRPGITLPVVETLDRALRPAVRHFPLGDDLLFDLELGSLGDGPDDGTG